MSTTEIPSTMRAQFLDSYNAPFALRTAPVPAPTDPHDLLIKVDAASYCHTDAVLAAGAMPPHPPAFPHVCSHEFAGTIVRAGPAAPADLQPGVPVGVPGRSLHPCGTCFECAASPRFDADPPGYSVDCPSASNNGISAHGGFREYAVVDARQVAPVPPALSPVETAPLMCAGVTVYAAILKSGVRKGQRLGIMGCGGGLGHLGLQFATKMGLRVTGVDAADGPLALAKGLDTGADVVDARKEKAEEVRRRLGKEDGKELLGEMGLDAVIILPESQQAFDYGVDMLKNHAKCVVVSFPQKGFQVSAFSVVFRDITVVGSLVGSNKTLREMLAFAAEHNVKAVLRTYPLSKLNELVEEYHKGSGGKLVVDMSLE
ncbi:chaperonin 10-like protein [Lineolata rhizophorae]|uniref:Chaperonin 10-like protein n=1 Tax=Lineolata rhizophorae TaxID=578093 RepID=A0A6A6NNV8_9PEZI|nr:chaperonin 10-like protein [Lineolata rhizophorae]